MEQISTTAPAQLDIDWSGEVRYPDVPSPQPEWGTMLAESKAQMRYYPWQVIIPGTAIAVTVLSINLIGDGLRDALDPKLKNG